MLLGLRDTRVRYLLRAAQCLNEREVVTDEAVLLGRGDTGISTFILDRRRPGYIQETSTRN